MPTILSIEINSRLTKVGSSRIYLYCSTSILFVWKTIRELQSKHIYIQSKIKKPRTILVLPELKNIYTVRLSAPNARCPFCILGGTSKRALLIPPVFGWFTVQVPPISICQRKISIVFSKTAPGKPSKVRTLDFIKPRNIKIKHHKCQLLGSHIYSVCFFWWARRDLNPHVRNGH